jgi:hypothetical protein
MMAMRFPAVAAAVHRRLPAPASLRQFQLQGQPAGAAAADMIIAAMFIVSIAPQRAFAIRSAE